MAGRFRPASQIPVTIVARGGHRVDKARLDGGDAPGAFVIFLGESLEKFIHHSLARSPTRT
jgi:hypothetical protein